MQAERSWPEVAYASAGHYQGEKRMACWASGPHGYHGTEWNEVEGNYQGSLAGEGKGRSALLIQVLFTDLAI